MADPIFRARTSDKPECPWCCAAIDIWQNPSTWLPGNEDYDDKKVTCKSCGEDYWVSVETFVRHDFISRYRNRQNWEAPADGEGE